MNNQSEFEFRTLKACTEANLANWLMQQSSSPAAPAILFAKKNDGWLMLCVDYRMLNVTMVKNQYLLPLISKMIDAMLGARIFTKLHLCGAYIFIQIVEGNEYKTVF